MKFIKEETLKSRNKILRESTQVKDDIVLNKISEYLIKHDTFLDYLKEYTDNRMFVMNDSTLDVVAIDRTNVIGKHLIKSLDAKMNINENLLEFMELYSNII